MITKEKLIQQINTFPDQLSIDELIDKLVFIDKLEKRISLSDEDKTVSEEQVEKEMNQWFE